MYNDFKNVGKLLKCDLTSKYSYKVIYKMNKINGLFLDTIENTLI